MGKSGGETKIAVSAAGAGSFKMGKRAKVQVGLPFTPTQAFVLTVGLVVGTLALHLVGRILVK
jgi:hypothetical protein